MWYLSELDLRSTHCCLKASGLSYENSRSLPNLALTRVVQVSISHEFTEEPAPSYVCQQKPSRFVRDTNWRSGLTLCGFCRTQSPPLILNQTTVCKKFLMVACRMCARRLGNHQNFCLVFHLCKHKVRGPGI